MLSGGSRTKHFEKQICVFLFFKIRIQLTTFTHSLGLHMLHDFIFSGMNGFEEDILSVPALNNNSHDSRAEAAKVFPFSKQIKLIVWKHLCDLRVTAITVLY